MMPEHSLSAGEDLVTTELAVATKHNSTGSEDWSWHLGDDVDVFWKNLRVALPDGVNKLVIEGMRSNNNERSGILLDDISLQPCAELGEL